LAAAAAEDAEEATTIPTTSHAQLQYVGFEVFDRDDLAMFVRERNAETNVTVERIAELLEQGMIIGVIRGRQEWGPRALGHRSLIALPTAGIKARMNRLKKREFYRPVAPMVAEEEWEALFEESYATTGALKMKSSPFMSFAPRVREEVAAALPAIAHYDRTARVQSVNAAEEPWIHALLQAVKKKFGWAVLVNTSFNTKGYPIVNLIVEALILLDTEEELDGVVVEDVLFTKEPNAAKREKFHEYYMNNFDKYHPLPLHARDR
jgi:carbamoyltransferase